MIYFIVEGQTDKALIENILHTLGIDNDFKFAGLKGDGSVKRYIENLTDHELSENTYFAIIDADNSFSDSEKKLQKCIGDKKIYFFIFPDHKNSGELEDLILSSIDIDNKDEVIKCFNNYKQCIKDSINKDIENKHKLYAYTTLQHNQKPEEYIKTLDIKDNFEELKQKIKELFENLLYREDPT